MSQIHKRSWTTKAGKKAESYRVPYRVNGVRKFKQLPTKSSALAFSRNLDAFIAEQERLPDPTVAEIAALWLAACRAGRDGEQPLEPETIRTYEGYVRRHIVPAFGQREITSLTRKDVIDFRDKLLMVLARITTKKVLGALKSICLHAINLEVLKTDPTLKVVVKLGGRHKSVIEIPSKAEMTKLVDVAFERSTRPGKLRMNKVWTRYSLILELAVYCGLRLSEIRGLPRHALNFDKGTLKVMQRADRKGRVGPPKSVQSRRTLYMPETLSLRLQAWLRTHSHELVFPSPSGKPLFPENIRHRMWDVLLELTSTPSYHLHATRHFYASRLIENGATPKELSAALGHADEGFTLETYGHLFHDAESERKRRDRANNMVLSE